MKVPRVSSVNVNTTDATTGVTALLLPAQNTYTLHDRPLPRGSSLAARWSPASLGRTVRETNDKLTLQTFLHDPIRDTEHVRAGGVEDGLGVLGGLAGCGYLSNLDHASNHGA